jgi:DivIVA domain-containing protein
VDLTPELVNDVDFRTRRGGAYDADEVDDFLEKVAKGVGELQERVRHALERAATAESQAREATARASEAEAKSRDAAEADDALKRTLVLAQRTADAAVREAEEHAARTVAAAEERAARTVAEADEKARKLVADAEDKALSGAEETKQRLVEEIMALESTRDAVQADVLLLHDHVEQQRDQMRSAAAALQRFVDDPAGLRLDPEPELSGASAPPSEVGDVHDRSADRPAPEPPADPVDEPTGAVGAVDLEFDDEDKDLLAPLADDDLDPDDDWGPEPASAAADAPSADAPPERLGLFDGVSTDPAVTLAEERASTRSVPAASDADGDDAYLTELRKAMIDDDIDDLAPSGSEHRSRFGRRR